MKAIVHDRYGSLDLLELRELEPPAIGDDEVLVRTRAAGVHVGDAFGVRGTPLPVRFMTGMLRPTYGVPGLDVAGTVEAVGSSVTTVRRGDEVFGTGFGTCAELVRAEAALLVPKPANLSFEEAAAIPTSALAALHNLRDGGRLAAGQRVLVIGAAGGVGSFAIQVAKVLGAEVTGVCSTSGVELVRSLGADDVIDYTRQDFADGTRRWDLILDNVESRPLREVRRALAPNGTLVLNSGTGASGLRMYTRLVWPLLLSPFVSHRLTRHLSNPNPADLAWLAERAAEGSVRPVVGSRYPLERTADALRHIETGHSHGKVVVAVSAA